MIVYKADKIQFLSEIENIDQILAENFVKVLSRHPSVSEQMSWKHSLRYMRDVLKADKIPENVGVAIEFQVPQTSKRLDFMITGVGRESDEIVIIVELKQWNHVELTDKDGIVFAPFYGSDVSHPSYQAWSYAELFKNFNKVVYTEDVTVLPCAYLHNYIPDNVITHKFYKDYIDLAPVFLEGDDEKTKLKQFIIDNVQSGDASDLLSRIDKSEVRPSKSLADSLVKMIQGNVEFIMIDEQKVVYENILKSVAEASTSKKKVIVVEGGPGTGKSVIAINLLVELTNKKKVTKYITRNAAPRSVYESLLSGSMKKSKISTLFSGSGSFTETMANEYDVLIVDEAHRLTAKSGMFQNKGENQIKELIYSSKCSVFFIDELQKVTWKDIGKKSDIEKYAKALGAEVIHLKLTSQFRCNGSDGYLAWLDNALQIQETANETLDTKDYDLKIVDSPTELQKIIFEMNEKNNKARIVAGYCWDWVSKKNKNIDDIVLPEFGFSMKWNLANDGPAYIIQKESVKEVGCIHTVQGLELDYVGVIVGEDLVVRDGYVVTQPQKRSKGDKSLNGFKAALKENQIEARKNADDIIKNTYRTLMTRGQKGCIVYFTDKETAEYFKSKISPR